MLQRKLAATAPVEMINLGVGGDQNEDVLRVLCTHYHEIANELFADLLYRYIDGCCGIAEYGLGVD